MKTKKELGLKVYGMTCGSCIRHVTEALLGVEGVCDVSVNLRKGTAQVRYYAGDVSEAAMVTALEEAGYEGRVDED